MSCPTCAAESERVPEHPKGRSRAKGEVGYEATEAAMATLGRFRHEHPHCSQCLILVGPGHVEPLSVTGKCSSCAGDIKGMEFSGDACIQLIGHIIGPILRDYPDWAFAEDGRWWLSSLGLEPKAVADTIRRG